MGIGDNQFVDKIFLLGRGSHFPTPSAALSTIGVHRLGFHIALVGNGHYHVFFRDQVFQREVQMIFEYFSAPFVAKLVANYREFVSDHFHQPAFFSNNFKQIVNGFKQLLIFVDDFLPFKTG